ncbi:hypothetical protein F511_33052 [Dorcoceras hygrometricum]|uniref:Uncharacterized protein n=1 Tax=Dorcoceras hygrometricum TaxID=472368 RepID=A0A2Z7BD97_9LAMI|nr:hypothetical protein F511_33052 [Dorcoceras hygrometricum]
MRSVVASHGPGSNPRGNAIYNAILLQCFRFYRSSVFNILSSSPPSSDVLPLNLAQKSQNFKIDQNGPDIEYRPENFPDCPGQARTNPRRIQPSRHRRSGGRRRRPPPAAATTKSRATQGRTRAHGRAHHRTTNCASSKRREAAACHHAPIARPAHDKARHHAAIARPARKRPASEWPTAQHRAAISRHESTASLIQALHMASGRAPYAANAQASRTLVRAAMMMGHRRVADAMSILLRFDSEKLKVRYNKAVIVLMRSEPGSDTTVGEPWRIRITPPSEAAEEKNLAGRRSIQFRD